MTMRKKDYEAIAAIIAVEQRDAPGKQMAMPLYNVVCGIADYCATQDPTFKRDRFLADCGVHAIMSTREFEHYHGCRMRDPDNCSGCALITGGEDGPNYAAWPLVYIENHRTIPAKWRKAFERELQSDNKPYADNIRAQIAKHGVRFSDAGPYTSASQVYEAHHD